METHLESFSYWLVNASGKAALLAVGAGLICLLLGRWIPAAWRHVLWALVFVRAIAPGDIGEFRWALPSWPVAAMEQSASETASHPLALPAWENFPIAPSHRVRATDGEAWPQPLPPAAVAMDHTAEVTTDVEAPTVVVPRPKQRTTIPISWTHVAAGLWAAGCVAWWCILGMGWLRFRRSVLAVSTEAPESLRDLLHQGHGLEDMRDRVRLRITHQIHTPAICGFLRPVILLPHSAVQAMPEEKLRMLFLHEMGHARRRDVLVQVLASVVLGLHWFNPLLWMAHRRLRAEAEAATDAWVLKRQDDGARCYGETLIDLAARCSWMGWLFFLAPSVMGAAESGTSLKSRIREIARYRGPSRWRWLIGVACASTLAVTGMTQQPPPAAPPTAPATETSEEADPVELDPDEVGGRIVNEKDRPVAGATVKVQVLAKVWNGEGPPPVPSNFRDPAPATTGPDGRWRIKGIPTGVLSYGSDGKPDVGMTFRVIVTHPDHLSLEQNYHRLPKAAYTPDFRKGRALMTLANGVPIRGRVTDASGNPVSGAVISRVNQTGVGKDPMATTDADGRYDLRNARTGLWKVRVEAKGMATWQKQVDLQQGSVLDVQMEPANTLLLKVVDTAQRPLSSTFIGVQLPREEPPGFEHLFTGMTDKDGRLRWEACPAGPLTLTVFHGHHQNVRVETQAGAEETLITLKPSPTLELRVVGADTQAPVLNATLERGMVMFDRMRGRNRSGWMSLTAPKKLPTGVYTERVSDATRQQVYYITAKGYTPQLTRFISFEKGPVLETVVLEPAEPLPVRVVQQDGTPAADARVYVLDRTDALTLESLDRLPPLESPSRPLELILQTDADGKCTLPYLSPTSTLLVIHPAGFFTVRGKDVPRDQDWTLGPWAQAEATVKANGNPAPDVPYEYQSEMTLPGNKLVSLRLRTKSDARGSISMPRVFPASNGAFAELLPEASASATSPRSALKPSADFESKRMEAGKMTLFQLESVVNQSWTVRGRLVPAGDGGAKLRLPRFVLLTRKDANSDIPAQKRTGQHAILQPDGSFEFRHVRPGAYGLHLWSDDLKRFQINVTEVSLGKVLPDAPEDARVRNLGDIELSTLEAAPPKSGTQK